MAEQMLVPTSVAAVAAEVQPDTILKWAERGKLTRYGTRYRRMWDLFEVRDLLISRADTPRPVLGSAQIDCQDSEQ